MTLIAMPARPIPATVTWAHDQPSQSNRSEFTGKRRTVILPQAPRWEAKVTLPVIQGEVAFRPWRAFLAQLRGTANSFRLSATEEDQISGVAVTVAAGGQAGSSLITIGWGPPGLKLVSGCLVTVGDQLLELVDDVVANSSGNAVLSFAVPMRSSPAAGAPIEVRRPYGVMSLKDSKPGWTVSPGQLYQVELDCEEAF